MSADHSVNFQSLNVVRDELVATIEAAARDLEAFVSSDQEDAKALQSCVNSVHQITGIMRMLELSSASMLAEELLEVTTEVSPGRTGPGFDRKMDAISTTFFILTRYLEYLQLVKHQVPVLLIPHINALRKIRHEPALPESHYLSLSLPATLSFPSAEDATTSSRTLNKEIRKIRQMYQIGLTGILREKQIPSSISLMRRAIKRLARYTDPAAPLHAFWYLADVALESIESKSMSWMETRKFLFMHLDRAIRQVESSEGDIKGIETSKVMLKEFIYLVILSGNESSLAQPVRTQFSSLDIPYTETELQKEYTSLYGPSSHTISSLAQVLQVEITNAKRTLENASQVGTGHIDDIQSFKSVLTNISEILSVVGLKRASDSLKVQLNTVDRWEQGGHAITAEEFDCVANTLLYLESTMDGLGQSDLSASMDADADPISQQSQIATHQLSSAIQIVIDEALGGLSLTKRALNSFADSDYDTGHIQNIGKNLSAIRGAMSLLCHPRAEAVLQKSASFVDEVLLDREPPAAINELLETFADVIISVEYYFDSADNRGNMDDSVLKIAEESLEALGYSVTG